MQLALRSLGHGQEDCTHVLSVSRRKTALQIKQLIEHNISLLKLPLVLVHHEQE